MISLPPEIIKSKLNDCCQGCCTENYRTGVRVFGFSNLEIHCVPQNLKLFYLNFFIFPSLFFKCALDFYSPLKVCSYVG